MNGSTKSADAIVSDLNAVNTNDFATDEGRNRALLAAYALPALGASLKVAKDLQLFEKWHERGNSAENSNDLAAEVSCDPVLLARILRHLAANHVLQEVSADVFKPTKFSISLLQPVFGEWITYLYDASLPCFHKMPEFLQKTGYRNPTDPADGIFQYAKGCKGDDCFQYYAANPRECASFNHVMGGVMAHQASWLDVIPVGRFLDGSDPNTPLVVDVGGNVGHDLEKFRQAYPHTAAQLYLQDLASVVEASACPDPVNKMHHDFFQPQPVQGSRVYFMHGVLHDWSDKPARKILQMLRDALKPGYSKLLVYDHVVPETSAHPHATSYDLTMMVKVAGMERTETQWRALLQSAGYKVAEVWRSPLATQAILEAELA
ncbi:hypothetical protein Daus18300_006600 [Diaporthe australafricana]|uniref:O-methyltransferase domain-containing protein n=1 Tax=Diaporthe australafricana TaxID=127596 RepID=A0ABR3WTB0_9PEZI